MYCICYIILATDVESCRNCLCLGEVYGVIGKIQILAGIRMHVYNFYGLCRLRTSGHDFYRAAA